MLLSEDQRDCLQEIANVAMGQAADRLARLFDAFVVLSIPQVGILTPSDIAMTLESLRDQSGQNEPLTGVAQGFIGDGVAGEALLLFNGTRYQDLAELLKYDYHPNLNRELLMDTSNVLGGACLHGLARQLDTHLSLGPPHLLDPSDDIDRLLTQRDLDWNSAAVVEINYTIEHYRINCDLLLVISENCIAGLLEKLDYLID